MAKFSDISSIDINSPIFNSLNLVFTNSKDLDLLISMKGVINSRKINQLIYNEAENVYTFEELNISKNVLFNNLHLICFVRASEINTKKGTSIKLADGEIIPILDNKTNDVISSRGLNESESNFYYNSSLNAFIFSNRDIPTDSLIYIHGTHQTNGYLKCDREIEELPNLSNYELRNTGDLAPYNTRQQDAIQEFKITANGSDLNTDKVDTNQAGSANSAIDSVYYRNILVPMKYRKSNTGETREKTFNSYLHKRV